MLAEILVLTAVLELFTCLGRFGFKIRARDVQWPVRTHHGYVGIVLLFFKTFSEWAFIVGAALILSDALHHFVVLPATVGSTEFP